jgi:hypothetical protein
LSLNEKAYIINLCIDPAMRHNGCGETVLPSRNFKATKLANETNENLNDIWYNYSKFCVVGDNGVI